MTSLPSPVKSYFEFVKNILTSNPLVIQSIVKRERVGSTEGFIQLSTILIKGYQFDVFEYYSTIDGVTNYKYHLMDTNKELVARWDNAPHHPEISTHPHHVHFKNKLDESKNSSLSHVLSSLPNFI